MTWSRLIVERQCRALTGSSDHTGLRRDLVRCFNDQVEAHPGSAVNAPVVAAMEAVADEYNAALVDCAWALANRSASGERFLRRDPGSAIAAFIADHLPGGPPALLNRLQLAVAFDLAQRGEDKAVLRVFDPNENDDIKVSAQGQVMLGFAGQLHGLHRAIEAARAALLTARYIGG